MDEASRYLVEVRKVHPAVAEYAAWRREGHEYVIPYYDALGRERTHRFHVPGGKPKYRSLPGDSPHLYCVENVRYGQVVLAEGEVDTLSVLSCGLKAVGVSGANAFHKSWVHLLDHVDDLIIALDGDEAGRTSARNLKSLLPQARIAELPKGYDLNDVLKEEGPKSLQTLLAQAK